MKTKNGHISRVKHYGNSLKFTLKEHLRLKHGIQCADFSIESTDNHKQERLESTDQNKTSMPKGTK